ncbi:hypothetical protein EYF80_039889 [Liparis tanakae]|uniref:Uncharacterized protein n=1 Tax=Liparis tanakae TaxID=230148 RepID=A0A4Z2G8N7_9TELE|nr:hypothetical protein EYF80_039889 [Liparis tanakae]
MLSVQATASAFPSCPWLRSRFKEATAAPGSEIQVIVAHMCTTSARVGIKSDTNPTGTHDALIPCDQFCRGPARLKGASCLIDSVLTLRKIKSFRPNVIITTVWIVLTPPRDETGLHYTEGPRSLPTLGGAPGGAQP